VDRELDDNRCEMESTPGFVDSSSPLHWRQDIAKSGYNIMSLGIIYEAIMRWVGRASTVCAMGEVFVKSRFNTEKGILETVLIPDHIDILAKMAIGAQLRMHFTLVEPAFSTSPLQEITLNGTEGLLKVDVKQQKLFGVRKGDECKDLSEININESERRSWRVEEEFISAIRGLEAVRFTTFDDGVDYMQFTEAVWRSMKEHRTVPV